MGACRVSALRCMQPSFAKLTSSVNGFCGRLSWWASTGQQECGFSSVADESLCQHEGSLSQEVARGPWQRWKKLPPVPLESAVRALEEIDGEDDNLEGRIKRLTALRWVAKCCPNVPHNLINKLFRLRQIRMRLPCGNSSTDNSDLSSDTRLIRVAAKEALIEGAVLYIPSAVSQGPDDSNPARDIQEATAEDIKWLRSHVLHKDEEVIVINKPIGLAVQGGTEVTRSLDSMMESALSFDYNEGPRLVHRLDKETSGALVVGRTHQSTVFLHALFRTKTAQLSQAPQSETLTMERRYWALVIGIPEAKKGRILAPLSKVVTDSGKLEKMRVVHDSHPSAQQAITDYKVLGSSVLGCSWLELHPLTGRKHQIRVHCAEVLGMPIVGDYKYGWRAHRIWPPDWEEEVESTIKRDKQKGSKGHVYCSKPFLHLHCRQLTLPNVAEVFKRQSRKQFVQAADVSGEKWSASASLLDITAPLPPHMLVSWNLRPIPKINL